MQAAILVLTILFTSHLGATAYVSKKLTAIVPRSNISKQQYRELKSYAKNLGKEIKANWFPPGQGGNLRTVVKLNLNINESFSSIAQQGSIQTTPASNKIEISETSGNNNFDQSCVKAVSRSAALFDQINYSDIEYAFEYKNKAVNFPIGNMITWPFRLGMGYASRKLGVNHFVQIPIY